MLTASHQISTGLPRAHGHDNAPRDAENAGPDQRLPRSLPIDIRPYSTMPGNDAGLVLISGQRFNRAKPTTRSIDNKETGDHDDSGKQHEHHRVSEDDPA